MKDLALQGGVTESICLSVQNCSSQPDTSYHFSLIVSFTLNPLSTEARTCVCLLLLLLPSVRAVNPAQSLVTKRIFFLKKKVLVISFRL